jgi:hypothetical protein
MITGLRDVALRCCRPTSLSLNSPHTTPHLWLLDILVDHNAESHAPTYLPQSSAFIMETFRFRLNCIDHYQAAPTELDPLLRRNAGLSQRQAAPQVPIIRAFGATETGQKVCAHIHGALPYLYLEYNGTLEKDVGRRDPDSRQHHTDTVK